MDNYTNRTIITSLMLAAVAAAALLSAWPASAHHAPSGWKYPKECCSGSQDCQMIHAWNVHVGASGYQVTLGPKEHRHSPDGGTYLFPYRTTGGEPNPDIRISGDTDYHICIGTMGQKRCLYVPPRSSELAPSPEDRRLVLARKREG